MEEKERELPRGPKGLDLLKQTKIVGRKRGLENAPEIEKALEEDEESLRGLDDNVDVDSTMEEALSGLGSNIQGKIHPIGNGRTVPFPDDGEPTTDFAKCRKHIPGVDRGCRHYGTTCRLPQLVAKMKEESGPFNLRYKDLRSGVVKSMFCTEMAATYLRMPNIVLIPPSENDPPGETWVPTVNAEYTPLPNGQMPTPGPGQPRTPIKYTGRKTRVVCHPSARVTREYQLMRRRGDFDKKPAKVAARNR